MEKTQLRYLKAADSPSAKVDLEVYGPPYRADEAIPSQTNQVLFTIPVKIKILSQPYVEGSRLFKAPTVVTEA